MEREDGIILGESPLWCGTSQHWYFVDIIKGHIYLETADNRKVIVSGIKYVSNLVKTKRGFLVSAENKIYAFNKETQGLGEFCTISQPTNLRTNDGAVGPDGRYWFGTMEKAPSGLNGHLYSLDSYGTLVHQGDGIGIPNSFIWLDDKYILISDSYLQKTYKVELLESGHLDWKNRTLWLDLSGTNGTPDGGAKDINGNVWLAIWGDGSIHKYSPSGKLLKRFAVDALQPTSCCFGGKDMDEIFITTATEGLSEQELMRYPDSGNTLRMQEDVQGVNLPEFHIAE